MKKPNEEYEVSEDGVTHVPTGAMFRHIPGKTGEGTMHLGNLVGHPEYRAEQVKKKMRKRWADFITSSKSSARLR